MSFVKHPTRARLGAAVAASAVLALAITGCTPSESSEDNSISTLKVGTVALGQLPLDHAEAEGYLTEFDIELQAFPSGAAAIPAMIAGEIDVAYVNHVSAGLAIAQGLDLKFVANFDSLAEGSQVAFVQNDGPIDSVTDLAGETVSVNALQTLSALGYQVAMEEAGGDPASLKFTEVSFAESVGILNRGEIAAAYTVQPFTQPVIDAGDATVLIDFAKLEAMKDLPIAGLYTTSKFAESHPEVITQLQEATKKSLADFHDDIDIVAAQIEITSEVDAATAMSIAKAILYNPEFGIDEVQRVWDLEAKYGFIKGEIDGSKFAA